MARLVWRPFWRQWVTGYDPLAARDRDGVYVVLAGLERLEDAIHDEHGPVFEELLSAHAAGRLLSKFALDGTNAIFEIDDIVSRSTGRTVYFDLFLITPAPNAVLVER